MGWGKEGGWGEMGRGEASRGWNVRGEGIGGRKDEVGEERGERGRKS